MSTADFDYLDVSTITSMVDLSGSIKIMESFPLVKITRICIDPEIVSKKKFKLPYLGKPGIVLSMATPTSTGTITRGIPKSDAFKNTITMDVSVKGKNVNLKVYESQIHMCGVKSRKMAVEASNIVIEKLIEAQRMLDYIRERPNETAAVIEWIKEKTRGGEEYVKEGTAFIVKKKDVLPLTDDMIAKLKEQAEQETQDMIDAIKEEMSQSSAHNNDLIQILDGEIDIINVPESTINPNLVGYTLPIFTYEPVVGKNGEMLENKSNPGTYVHEWKEVQPQHYIEKVNYIKLPEEFIFQGYHPTYADRPTNSYPEGINGKIANFLLDQAFDFKRHDFYCVHLNWIANLDSFMEGELGIVNVSTAMVNYNYDLGFHIKRNELFDRINGLCGFIPIFENTYDHSVKIQLPYDIPEELQSQIKIQGKPKHTFMVYKKGRVTQSSSCVELARDAYILFNRVIASIRPFIEEQSDEVITLIPHSVDKLIEKTLDLDIDWEANGTLKRLPKLE